LKNEVVSDGAIKEILADDVEKESLFDRHQAIQKEGEILMGKSFKIS